jgi:hypothetical protein
MRAATLSLAATVGSSVPDDLDGQLWAANGHV